MKKSALGFTLVELLVAMTVIALLITISIASYDSLTKNARDSQRKSDLKTIQSALEQYHSDNIYYPSSSEFTIGVYDSFVSGTGSEQKTYLRNVPIETAYDNPQYLYVARPDSCDNSDTSVNKCTKYCLFAKMENSSNAGLDTNCPATLPGASGYDYSVSSP